MRITTLLEMVAAADPDRVLLGHQTNSLTAGELLNAARSAGKSLRDNNRDSLVYLAENGVPFPVALFAASYASVPFVPLNYRLGEIQLQQLLAHYPKAQILVPTGSPAPAPPTATKSDPNRWVTEHRSNTAPGEFAPADEEAAAVIIYTSGSTAEPKGVLLRHENLSFYVIGSVEFLGSSPDEAALLSVPPYHIAAVANCLTSVYGGRRIIVLEKFTPEAWISLARSEGVTNALVVPTMLARIMESPVDKTIPTLKSLAYGGAPMPPSVIARALATWPEVDFVNAYGLTETSSTIALLGPDDHRKAHASSDPKERARLGSVGRAVPGVEIVIKDENGVELPPGEVGRILVRGAQVSGEYAGMGSTLDSEGFFDTRDGGYLDEDGYLFVGGRRDDTIIRGGENIAPAEIEEVFYRHPDVLDVAVIGVPDEEWGQRVVAAVTLRANSNATEAQLRDHVRKCLRGSKSPDEIRFWNEVPRTPTGKLVRREVVKRWESS